MKYFGNYFTSLHRRQIQTWSEVMKISLEKRKKESQKFFVWAVSVWNRNEQNQLILICVQHTHLIVLFWWNVQTSLMISNWQFKIINTSATYSSSVALFYIFGFCSRITVTVMLAQSFESSWENICTRMWETVIWSKYNSNFFFFFRFSPSL